MEYTHQVDTCPCGNCYKSRVDSGTQDAYMARVRAKVDQVMKKLEHEHEHEHKPFVCQCAKCKGLTSDAKK
jgi:deoxycytidylate deaminase